MTRRSEARPFAAGRLTLALLGLAACGDRLDPAETSQEADGPQIRAASLVVNPDGWVNVPAPADALMQGVTIPADAPTRGVWSAAGPWPMVGLHQAILPDGKVLTWGTTPDGAAQNGRYFDVWDPNRGLFDTGSHNTTYDANRQDSFCAPVVYAGDGRLIITGGNGTNTNGITSQMFTPSSGAFAQGPSVADARWYAAMVTLPDGRAMVLGGIEPYTEGQWQNPDQAVAAGQSSMTPEVLENGAWRTLFGAQSRTAFGPDYLRASLPKVWVAPDGRVFGIGTEQMYYVDPNGNGNNGAITIVGRYKTPPQPNATVDTAPNVGPTMSGVMYAPGKVMTVGGNSYHNGSGNPGSRLITSVDLNGGGAVLTELAPMANARNFASTIILPDGKVLVTGGETRANNDPAYGVYAAELWDPATNTWSTLASASVFRGYHSQTSLLVNGAVLSTGGGNPGPVQLKGEVYYPPYLFQTVNGRAQWAPRPTLVGISGLSYANGAQLQVDMASSDPIASLVVVGLSTGTHSFNNGQRRVPLAFSQDGFRLTATLPANTQAPPGYYQVIALNAAGVPSRGTVIAIGQGVAQPVVPVTPYDPPAIAAPGGSISVPVIVEGGTASYTVASSPGTTYSWSFGDGSAPTAFSATASTSHVFVSSGVYGVTITARTTDGSTSTYSFLQAVGVTPTAGKPAASSAMALELRANASARLWVANPDSDSVTAIDTATNQVSAELTVGSSPRSVAVSPSGRVWVTNKTSASISIVDPATLTVVSTVALPRASQPHGLVFAPGGSAFVVLEATGQLAKLDPTTGALQATIAVGDHPRHLAVTGDGATLLVSRFITAPLPGESTATVDTSSAGGEVLAVAAASMSITGTVVLRHSDKVDNEVQGSGIPNYLAAAVVSPDGRSAWVPSKQDNIKRGALRSGVGLNAVNTVRAISARIDLPTLSEDYARRVDHDNSGVGTAAVFHPSGAYVFVALETSRQVAVVDAASGRELAKVDVGRAPQALAISADGNTLYVQNFMDRSVSVLDLTKLMGQGLMTLPTAANVPTVAVERLPSQILRGKQLFYDARDPRLARDSYMSCASCHSDAGHDGRVWDFTGFGEGLRNTPSLRGRAGTGQGFVHWSANFDEIQDFEGQIRAFAGGTGLMSDAAFNTGTRSAPLGDRKAGVSPDLDALAAYVGSLASFDPSPWRAADGQLTAAGAAGKAVFLSAGCASCHTGSPFTLSRDASTLRNVGTLETTSGARLGGALTGIDVPTLRDVWSTRPYLHDGSAPTLSAAVQAHTGANVGAADLANLVAYLQQIGSEETVGTNLAVSAALATSYVSAWETLAAVNNGITPASSADHSTGAYGNWRGAAAYGATDWVSFTWTSPKLLSAFEVYWWNDGQGIGTPTSALVEYWNGSAWQSVGTLGTALNTFNHLDFSPISTSSLRVSMSGAFATGILEARVLGSDAPSQGTNLAPSSALATSYVSPWETLTALTNDATPSSSADHSTGAYGNWRGAAAYGATDWVSMTWTAPKTLSALEVYWWNDGQGIGTPTYALAEYWNGSAWVSLGAPGLALNTFNHLDFAPVTTTSVRVSMKSALATGILEARAFGSDAPAVASNVAPSSTLGTSYVSPWETLAAVTNNVAPANSADRSTGAYGNWRGAAAYGATDWVSMTWAAPKTLSAFEVYWWNDGQGIGTPTNALLEYWNGSAWVSLGSPGLALNTFNRLTFTPVSTTALRVSMKSALATGILEARAFGF